MKTGDIIAEILTGVVVVAVIYMMVRPGSPVNAAIQQVSGALSALVATATQYQAGGNSGTTGSAP